MRRKVNGSSGGAQFVRGAVAALACLATLAGAAPAVAGDFGVRLGYYGGADADDPVPVIGVYDRLDIPGPLNLEISADYRNESLRGGDLEAAVVPLRLSAVLNLFPGVSPYLLAGVGADYASISFHNELSGKGDETDLVFEAHAGAGLEFNLGPLSVIGDLRYCAVGEVENDAVKAALGHAYDPSGWYASLAVGFSF
jgi:opacity protein-like surface antigen